MNRSAPGIDGIAIVADPIFQIDDPRVSNQQDEDSTDTFVAYLGNELLLGYERSGNGGLPRLPGTQIEARAIEDVAGDVDILSLYGADANRDAVLSGQLSDYGILHFATHGIVDDIEPALSGLVLSAVTREGKARDSFLRTQDILTLSIDAELVVLSGCDTGLGRPVYGEGLVGLSRAFFVAGADRVVSSLWKVPDTATAELMARFYRALLENDASPSEALRIAQSEIREQPRWSNPYFWASFVIHGNWK
jgi:CHAT domain-containing protein